MQYRPFFVISVESRAIPFDILRGRANFQLPRHHHAKWADFASGYLTTARRGPDGVSLAGKERSHGSHGVFYTPGMPQKQLFDMDSGVFRFDHGAAGDMAAGG